MAEGGCDLPGQPSWWSEPSVVVAGARAWYTHLIRRTKDQVECGDGMVVDHGEAGCGELRVRCRVVEDDDVDVSTQGEGVDGFVADPDAWLAECMPWVCL